MENEFASLELEDVTIKSAEASADEATTKEFVDEYRRVVAALNDISDSEIERVISR